MVTYSIEQKVPRKRQVSTNSEVASSKVRLSIWGNNGVRAISSYAEYFISCPQDVIKLPWSTLKSQYVFLKPCNLTCVHGGPSGPWRIQRKMMLAYAIVNEVNWPLNSLRCCEMPKVSEAILHEITSQLLEIPNLKQSQDRIFLTIYKCACVWVVMRYWLLLCCGPHFCISLADVDSVIITNSCTTRLLLWYLVSTSLCWW